MLDNFQALRCIGAGVSCDFAESAPIHLRYWELLSVIFSSDLRKPCCWHGKVCIQLRKMFVYENMWNLVQPLHWPNRIRTLHLQGICCYRENWYGMSKFWPHHWTPFFLATWFDVSHAYVMLRISPWKILNLKYHFSWIGGIKTSSLTPLASFSYE